MSCGCVPVHDRMRGFIYSFARTHVLRSSALCAPFTVPLFEPPAACWCLKCQSRLSSHKTRKIERRGRSFIFPPQDRVSHPSPSPPACLSLSPCMHCRGSPDINYCPHCFQSGGPANIRERGGGKPWPHFNGERAANGNYIESDEVSKRHGICGDPEQVCGLWMIGRKVLTLLRVVKR